VIGTLARRCAAAGRDVVISTGDKDMAQLVCPHVRLVNTMTGSVYDVEGVKAKFGVGPELIIDFLALMGDKVDNIPGVPGVGEKTALALLNGIAGGLDGLYANLDKVAELSIRGAKTLGAKLAEHREAAYLSYQLATIKIDVELEVDIDGLQPQPQQREALIELYRQLEFRSWLDAVLREAPAASAPADDLFAESAAEQPAPVQYVTLTDPDDFQSWLQRLGQAELFSFNTKLNGADPQQADLVGLAFAVAPGEAAYLPLAHTYMGVPAQLDRDAALAALKPLLEDPARPKVVQHGKADIEVLERYGVALRGVAFDTMLESYVLDSTATRHDLDSLAL